MNLGDYKPPVIKKPQEFVPSSLQQAAFDWVDVSVGSGESAVMIAVAGSGKSRTLRYIYEKASSKVDRILLVCFGKDNMLDARKKNLENLNVPNVSIITYHSYGNSAITSKHKPEVDLRGEKVETILKNWFASNQRFLIGPTKKLVSLCKNTEVEMPYHFPTNEELDDIAMSYDISFGDEVSIDLIDKAYGGVRYALQKSADMVDTLIDFDDMIYLPIVLGLTPDKYDLILCDEFQDTNKAQAALIRKGITDLMIGVGDPNQSIFAFRGADSHAMDNLITQFNAHTLPLSICYRCPQAVGDLVRAEFPYIDFQTPDWAIPGSVTSMAVSKSLDAMQEGDLIVSRINAALPKIAFSLIRKGKTARIMGRNIGKSLETLIKKQNAYDIPDLSSRLYKFRESQFQKFVSANRPDKIQQLDDQVETIMALSEGANSVYDIITRCNTMFSDDNVGIQLGTIHKNKGREAKNVYIARPDLLPLPFVMKKGNEESKRQEINMKYVAETRSTENLIFLEGEL